MSLDSRPGITSRGSRQNAIHVAQTTDPHFDVLRSSRKYLHGLAQVIGWEPHDLHHLRASCFFRELDLNLLGYANSSQHPITADTGSTVCRRSR